MGTPTEEMRFRCLYDRHHPDVLAYFSRRIGREAAQDAADEVFAVAWRRIDDVPPDDQAILWLYGVAHGVLRNHDRGTRRLRRLVARLGRQQPALPEQPEAVVLRTLDEQAAVDALCTLRRDDQELLRLAYWEELTHGEIGEVLGCSKSAVDARVHRALQRMRQALRSTGHMADRRSGTEITDKETKC